MKIFHVSFLLILFFQVFSRDAYGQSDRSLNEQAMQEYSQGHYDEALEIWYSLLKNRNTDPDLFYNIGNAESMKGNIPNAILHYERALRYKPGNKEFQHAIRQVRSQVKNAAIPVNSFFLTDWIKNLLSLLRPGHWAILGLFFLLAGVLTWLGAIRVFEKYKLKGNLHYKLLLGTGLFILLIAFGSYRQIYRSDEAIIFTECDFREAPTQESPLTRSLHPGEKIIIMDQLSGWFKVNLVNLDEGWIKEDCFIRIQ